MVPRAAGWVWGLLWLWIMIRVLAPWNDLGGVVGERVRWLGRLVPSLAVIVGCLAGTWSRMAAQRDPRRTHLLLLRWVLWPPGAIVAAALIVLNLRGYDDVVGVVVAGFLGYWVGLDLGFAIWPLICGRHYSLSGAIEPDPPEDAERSDQDDDVQRWFPI